jgi:hypothetical protein
VSFVAAGGLMSYGGSLAESFRWVGVYAGRILKGEQLVNLPVQQSTKIELFINLFARSACWSIAEVSCICLKRRISRPASAAIHAARAKFSGIGKQSAASLNSKNNDTYLSAAIVVAVCEDGKPLASFGAKPRSNSILTPLSGVASLSSLLRKYAADEFASWPLFL